MGKIFTGNGWVIVVRSREHSPVHAHVLHPDGTAVVFLDGGHINSGVPGKVLKQAVCWVADNAAAVGAEWVAMNNPRKR